jgi:hypothetical protein
MSELYYSLVFTSSSIFLLTLYSDNTEPAKLQLNYDTLMDMQRDDLISHLKDYPKSIALIVQKIRETFIENKEKLAKIAKKLDGLSNKKIQVSAENIKNDLSQILNSIQDYKTQWNSWYTEKDYKSAESVNLANILFENVSLKGVLEKIQQNYPELYDSVNKIQSELNDVIQSQLKTIFQQELELDKLKTELKTYDNMEEFKKIVNKTLEKLNEKIKKLSDQLDEKEKNGTSTTTDSAEIENLQKEKVTLQTQVTNLTAQLNALANKQSPETPVAPGTPQQPQPLSEEDEKKIKTLEDEKIELATKLKDVREKLEKIKVSPETQDEIDKLTIDETIYSNRINDLSIEVENIKNTQRSPKEKVFITVTQNDKKQLYLQIEKLRQNIEKLNDQLKTGDKKLSKGITTCKDYYTILKNEVNYFNKLKKIIEGITQIKEKLDSVFSKISDSEKVNNTLYQKYLLQVQLISDYENQINNMVTKLQLSEITNKNNENVIQNLKDNDSTDLPEICNKISDSYEEWKKLKNDMKKLNDNLQELYKTFLNLNEDIGGAVRVYVRIKTPPDDMPLLKINLDLSTNTINELECSDTLKLEAPSKFYKIADKDWSTLDVFTGIQGSKTMEQIQGKENSKDNDKYLVSSPPDATKNGLYSTFKQVEDGYSIVLFGYGLSGSGKCHGKGTEILMYDGSIKKVEDIQVGDLLMGDDSTPRKVLSLAHGKDKMFEISNTKGDTYVVNSEHILTLKYNYKKYLRDRKDRFTYQVCYFDKQTLGIKSKQFSYKKKDKIEVYNIAKKYLDEIQDNLIIDIPLQKYIQVSKRYKSKLHGFKVPVDFEEKPLELDPYMLGVWLGDGHQNTCCITNQDAPILEYFRDNLPKYNCYLSFQNSSNYTYRICSNEKLKHHETTNYFTIQLQQNNLINNKHIPMMYKCNSRENRLNLLAGILDSNGHLSKKGGYEICQSMKHEKLMDDIVYLCRSLGFSCYKNIKKTSWTHNDQVKQGEAIRIHINGNGIEEIPVLSNRKKPNSRQQIKDPLVSPIQIKELQEDDYYGFEIDGNHRYVLGNFIVTHNTFTLIGNEDSPGILYFGLANLSENVESISIQHIFEQYKREIDLLSPPSIIGQVISLYDKDKNAPFFSEEELNSDLKYRDGNYIQPIKNEKKEFSKFLLENKIDLDGLNLKNNYSKINNLMNLITEYRKQVKDNRGLPEPRIKKTVNNPESSRSHLFIVFKVTFVDPNNSDKKITGYVTIVDMAGKESPQLILNVETDGKTEIGTSLMRSTSLNLSEQSIKNSNPKLSELFSNLSKLNPSQNKEYKELLKKRESEVKTLVSEGIYINESLNHLRYYLSKKANKPVELEFIKPTSTNSNYDPNKFYNNPKTEMPKSEENTNPGYKVFMIPILEKLDTLGKEKDDTAATDNKPTKFVMINTIRLEQKYCSDSLDAISFVNKIKSSVD